MDEQPHSLLKASAINSIDEFEFHHPLNPNSEVYLRTISRVVGLKHLAITLARIPPKKESFIYHLHHHEEEWIYILSGRGIAEIGDNEYEVSSGDFMGFGLPQQPHHLRNPFNEDLVYLMGGEKVRCDIGIFPRLGKRAIRDGDAAYIINDSTLQDFWSSKEASDD
ncbi:cupin domain-containing protein [Gloeocapsopsis crepidinum LEGE 06123]|uniref:Cupin domain-containing protein n=1 Tax=Gloeocapsopsis crepidinum LEGE 06123 TaxID=588587 RepID=A0ABR9ULU2_9CHRO|nr:cupin domain-containing protein [Gloeocapsopsis crepidinum]MBE9189251.1 cupin domain-containing protein [Gloeocapsopsis crepidinum LEGE 06123]